MKARSPDKPVGTGVFTGFDIRRSHDEISLRFNTTEKIAEARVHRIILDGLVDRCNAWDGPKKNHSRRDCPDESGRFKSVADRKTPATAPTPIPAQPRVSLASCAGAVFPKLPLHRCHITSE